MESFALDSQDPSKRKWTPAEDIKLVKALVEYHQEIEGSLENKFKPGYLKALEGSFQPNYLIVGYEQNHILNQD